MKPTIAVDSVRVAIPRITAHWDNEGSTLSCEIDYGVEASEATLSASLDRAFNIVQRDYILTGGTFSMALDPQKRLKDWDIFTNPAQWIECAFPFIEATSGTPHLDAAFDENRRAESMGAPRIFYEPHRGTVYLAWDEAGAWHAVGPTLALGVTSDQHLAQIRLDGVFISKKSDA